MVKKHTKT